MNIFTDIILLKQKMHKKDTKSVATREIIIRMIKFVSFIEETSDISSVMCKYELEGFLMNKIIELLFELAGMVF